MNILAIGCHPDDIEVACAGTLARYTKEGHKVIACHVANGNLGHAVSKLVFDASFAASVPYYMNGFGEAAPVTPLYYMGMRDHDNIDFAEFVKTNNTKRMLP